MVGARMQGVVILQTRILPHGRGGLFVVAFDLGDTNGMLVLDEEDAAKHALTDRDPCTRTAPLNQSRYHFCKPQISSRNRLHDAMVLESSRARSCGCNSHDVCHGVGAAV